MASFLLLTAPALAQQSPSQVPAEPEPPIRGFSLTVSPFHLGLPVVELTGEYKLSDKLGLAVVAGAGAIKVMGAVTESRASVIEGGTSLRYYLLGNFRHGMQIGAELLYIYASASDGSVSASANGAAVGPFLGYKFTSAAGFTFDSQLGVAKIGIAARSSAGNKSAASEWAPLLNINVGWSF